MKADRIKSYKYGLVAETVVCNYLRLKGYSIMERRFKTPVGEIDIVARRRKTIAVIEVKARKAETAEVLTNNQKKRISRAAALLIAKYPKLGNSDIRFDLVTMRSLFKITHIEDAWRPEN